MTALLLLAAGAAQAALDRSPFPKPRPERMTITEAAARQAAPARPPVFGPSADTVRPRKRPARNAVSQQVVAVSAAEYAPMRSPAPKPRPADGLPVVKAAAVQSQPAHVATPGGIGKICGDRAIRGRTLAPIPGKLKGCGVSNPVEVVEVDGVALTTAAVMTCDTARALKTWVKKGVKPAVGRRGGGVESLRVIASYSCRTRNNRPGAKISEHGRGKAVDIAAINLKNGGSVSVLDDWGKGRDGKILRKAHAKACGPFGTVLGPKADRYHRDHFHLDTASYRSGPYCR